MEKLNAMNALSRRAFPILLLLALIGAAQVSAQNYKVESAAATAPQDLAPAVSDLLSPQMLKISGPSGVVCEIWLRKSVPGTAPAQQLGVVFPQLPEGTLIGAIHFPANVIDYRRQAIKAGVYTLRYALSPVNGNHQGVAPQRDFLLATPAAVDRDPANLSESQTIEQSKKSTVTNHASVWSMAPGAGDPGAAPAISHDTDDDWWIVQFTVPVAVVGAPAPTRMGLVVVGSAAEV
jgi:hypothetical protein